METSVAGVTVRVVKPEKLPVAALIMVAALATAEVASPLLLIVATAGDDELQIAEEVRSFVEKLS